MHRCLQRHGISRLPDVEGDKPSKKKFKSYPIGFFHIDIAEVQTGEGKLYLYVGIDRTSKFAFAEDDCCTCPLPGPHHQCAFSTASTDVTPAIIDPIIATSAGTPRGSSKLISEAMKIAAMGRAMTK
jgi:hypothetical protein